MAKEYQRVRDRAQKRYRILAREGRDIGTPPPIADPARRAACEHNLERFCRTYCASWFWLPWSTDHLAVIERVQRVVLEGGRAAIAMPRGSGKTSMLLGAALWAILYQHRQFVLLIGASEPAARGLLRIALDHLETSELLLDDFPDAVYPIRCLEGVRHRAAAQLCGGQRTFVQIASNSVTLPITGGGGTLRTSSIGGRLRGFLSSNPATGQLMRPDLVLLDDIESDRSAKSRIQTARLQSLVSQGVLGLAGPGSNPAVFVLGTAISSSCLLVQLLEQPDWRPLRLSLLKSLPRRQDLWRQYHEIRTQELRLGSTTGFSKLFYLVHHREMNDGAEVSWSYRYEENEIDALESGMLKFLESPQSFWSEYQNQPEVLERQQEQERLIVTPAKLTRRLTGLARCVVPSTSSMLTAFVDIQKRILYYVVAAWDARFGGSVIAYGTWPEQTVGEFTAANPPLTLQQVVDAETLEGQIRAGLRQLLDRLLAWSFSRDGSNETLQISLIGIDAAWGLLRQALDLEAHHHPQKARLLLTQGRVVTHKSRSFAEAKPKPGDRVGHEWMLAAGSTRGRLSRFLLYDTNYWKNIVADKLTRPPTDPGGINIHGDSSTNHTLLFEHLSSESRDDDGQWTLRTGFTENHWWDCLVGAAVLANVQGLDLAEMQPTTKRRVSFARLQSEAKHERAAIGA